jgi:hypothetical protein
MSTITHKATYSNNPLAAPSSPIHRLAARLQDYLHFPDPYPLYTLIAALVANICNGRPVWLMLIGPSSCGKSELLNSLLSIPRVKEGGSISSPAAFLSGTRKKDRTSISTGGLLRETGDRGALVIKEFTSILSLSPETYRQVLACFREIYDGRYTRSVGADGGNSPTWVGKLAVLTGCTEAIDHHHQLVSDMGERFIFFRYGPSDGWSEAYQALSVTNTESLSANLQASVVQFADELALDWDNPPELEPLTSQDKQRIIAFSQFTANGRSSVTRDAYNKEITGTSTGEYPIRLSIVLGQMLQSLRYIGCDETDTWRIIRKLSFDSIPGTRRYTLLALLDRQTTVPEIAQAAKISQSCIRRSLEELRLHNLVEQSNTGWGISPWAKERIRDACNGAGLTGMRLRR